ncbi:Os09g0121900 [Oryza sativa Japonica Group]|uniref:Os09g0121900 protein n=1 Tax=Oryza sativa subsp. japonica TaxID=39947 RepID=A0A0P0XIW7_ORYSJ|nr:Os09g0121900 [Oryza sativa Japonica Group]
MQVHQHVPLDEYQSNLRAICAYFKEQWPSTKIILITPPPIYEPVRIRDMYGEDDPSKLPERTNEAAGTYAQACLTVAKELNHPVIDIWTKMQQFPDWQTSALWYGSISSDLIPKLDGHGGETDGVEVIVSQRLCGNAQ